MLEISPMGFSELRKKLDMKSSGNLDHHLRKIKELVCVNHQGLYALTDYGREALKGIRTIEATMRSDTSSISSQSKLAFMAVAMLGGGFLIALFLSALPIMVSKPFDVAFIGVAIGFLGAVIGYLASMKGVKASITSDGKSHGALTYWPSLGMRWEQRDWALNILLFGSWFILLFNIIFVQVFLPWVGDYGTRILWYSSSLLSLTALFLSAIATSRRIILKATKLIQKTSQSVVSTSNG